MHDGGEKTLADVVAFYNRGGVKNSWLSDDVRPFGLDPSREMSPRSEPRLSRRHPGRATSQSRPPRTALL
jgi:cytochrome c peroxidase